MDLKKLLKIFEAPVQPGTGASGFPLQNKPAVAPVPPKKLPVIGPNAKARTGQAAKPAANPNQAAVDAANRVQTGQTAVTQGKPATDRFAAATEPTTQTTPAASTAVDPSIGSGQNLAAKAEPSPGTNPFAMRTPDLPADVGQAAKPAASMPPGLASATTPQGQAAKPSATPGLGAQTDAFAAPSGAAFADPMGTGSGQAAKPSSGGLVDGSGRPVTSSDGSQVKTGFSEEDELEEELNELIRLSGNPIEEKAVSKQQQKFMGMVHAMQKGKKIKGASPELKKAAKGMSKKAAHDYAATKHKGLPQKVSESVMLEAGSNLEHIVTRFKHETKNFLSGAELDDDLYNALYDYYIDNGEMPYGVAKAREGDPYQWVRQHFEDELAMMGHQRQFQETVMPVVDSQLSELARLAGLSESNVNECGDMGMEQKDTMNVSTNMSSDGTKNVTISASGENAEALMQMLKLAGMGHVGHSHDNEPVVMVSGDDEEMMEYANEPGEEYQTIDSIITQGNDLNRQKRQYADKPKLGDNPMAETKDDLSNIPTERLQDFVKKHSGGGVPTFGAGATLKRVQAELKRREKGMSEELTPDQKRFNKDFRNLQGARLKKKSFSNSELADFDRREQELRARGKEVFKSHKDVDEGIVDEELQGLLDSVLVKADEGSIKGGDRPGDLTGTWSADPPAKGKPNVPPPIPMDPVSAPTPPKSTKPIGAK